MQTRHSRHRPVTHYNMRSEVNPRPDVTSFPIPTVTAWWPEPPCLTVLTTVSFVLATILHIVQLQLTDKEIGRLYMSDWNLSDVYSEIYWKNAYIYISDRAKFLTSLLSVSEDVIVLFEIFLWGVSFLSFHEPLPLPLDQNHSQGLNFYVCWWCLDSLLTSLLLCRHHYLQTWVRYGFYFRYVI